MENNTRYIKTRKVYNCREKEKQIETKFREKIKSLGGKAYKFVSPGTAGVPDRLVILPGGKIGFAELKRPGGKLTKIQKRQLDFIKSLGCFVKVIYNIDDIDYFIGGINLWYDSKERRQKWNLHHMSIKSIALVDV